MINRKLCQVATITYLYCALALTSSFFYAYEAKAIDAALYCSEAAFSSCVDCQEIKKVKMLNPSIKITADIDPAWNGACPKGSGKKPPCNAKDWLDWNIAGICPSVNSRAGSICPEQGGSCSLGSCDVVSRQISCKTGVCQNPVQTPDGQGCGWIETNQIINPHWTRYTWEVTNINVKCNYSCATAPLSTSGGAGDPGLVSQDISKTVY